MKKRGSEEREEKEGRGKGKSKGGGKRERKKRKASQPGLCFALRVHPVECKSGPWKQQHPSPQHDLTEALTVNYASKRRLPKSSMSHPDTMSYHPVFKREDPGVKPAWTTAQPWEGMREQQNSTTQSHRRTWSLYGSTESV